MRILYTLPYVPSRIRVRPYHFIRELARRHDVSILATDSSRRLAQFDLADQCQRVEIVPWRLGTGLGSCVRGALRGEPLQAAVCQSPELRARLVALLEAGTFDIVHIEHLRAARLGALVPRHLPTLFDAVDAISLLHARTLRSSHSLRQRLVALVELQPTRAYEARLVRQFDRTIVTAAEDERVLRGLAPEAPVSVVPNGVDLEYFRPLARPREPATIVFWGKMSYHANTSAVLHFARNIFPLVRGERPDARLRVVGSDPPRAIRALAANPAISVTGEVDDLRQHVAGASVCVCPMTVKVGIQNKLLEAMAMGVPVVASPLAASGTRVVAGRDLLVADGAALFARSVCRVLADAELAARLAQAGRRYVERFHRWEVIVRDLEAGYAEAIARRDQRLSRPGRAA